MHHTVFTIVSRNYFAYARTLGDSLKKSNPDVEFNILIVDRKDLDFERQHADWKITWVEDLGIPQFEHVAFKYDILELNTNVKPTFAKRLLGQYEKVIYLDPDIYVYDRLQRILDLLDKHAVVLTPHITEPIDDDKLPGEPEFLNSGIYNLGFAAFNNTAESLKLLSWWERRCLNLAYNEQAMGFFVDQKWMDFVPSLCATAFVLRDRQYNVAYWNLHERTVDWDGCRPCVDGLPLTFFHFSGLPPEGDDRVSKYQTRFRLKERPDVLPLFVSYRELLKVNGHDNYLKLAYGFGNFTDGMPISALARRVVADSEDFQNEFEPFLAGGSTYKVIKRARLVIPIKHGKSKVNSVLSRQPNEEIRLLRLTGILFGLLLRALGPSRYVQLMRFVGRVSNLRNQTFLLKQKL
jgi:hypothetical protein